MMIEVSYHWSAPGVKPSGTAPAKTALLLTHLR